MGTSTKLTFGSVQLPSAAAQAAQQILDRIENGNGDEDLIQELASLGRLREEALIDHRVTGAVFTPYPIAQELVDLLAVDVGEIVCDPSAGSGIFLLAAAERKFQGGESVSSIAETLRGIDIDPVSVEVARLTLKLWAIWRGGRWPSADHLMVGDGLLAVPEEWLGTCDVVIGNPPFLGQLKSETSRDRSRAQALKQRFGSRYTAYVDESMLFFLLAVELISKDGRVSLIVPSSTLGSDSSQLAREWIDSRLALSEIWVGGRSVFDSAAVDVIAPILRSEKRDECTIVRYETQDALVVPRPLPGRWSSLLAHANGVPTVAIANTRRLGNRAVVTADFRDAYYWLAERVVEAVQNDDRPKLVTVGLVDPFCYRYGDVQTRFAKQRFQRPVVKIEDNPPTRLASWVEQRLIPKLLVATQTRIVECYADIKGELLPSTPLVTIIPEQESQLWHLMAAVSSPPASAWLASAAAGTGLSQGTMRLRASLIADLPLPELSKAWDLGAELAHEIQENGADDELLRRFGETMNQAYGFPSSELLHWWISQIPKKRP
tara:strand:+ start:4862 stop:6505 length:1644 start_codon:yes stop_codon:yes gene_type:complete